MNRRHTLWLLLALASGVLAQNRLEIIGLRYRTADEMLPVLRPLLEPGGTLSAHGHQLFVRASPANLAELRRVLDSIDRPARRLQISVRFDDAAEASRQALGARGHVGTEGAAIELRADQRSTAASERVDQRLQVLEGGRAMIFTGTWRGVPHPQTIAIQERATGFEVVPRLSGQAVQLEVFPQRDTGERFQRIATTVQARLGEWVEIGGAESSAGRGRQGVLSTERSASTQSRRVFLRVEELAN